MIYMNTQDTLAVSISRLINTTLLFHFYLSSEFQIEVEQAAIDHVRNNFAPSDDPVFEPVPPEFSQYATILYQNRGSPVIYSENICDI